MSKSLFPALAAKTISIPTPPADTLRELNLEDELLAQYKRAKLMLSDADTDETVTLAQKVQTLNGITTILSQIIKSQGELYSLERVKAIESTLISTLKAYPEVSAAFLEAYELALPDDN